MNANNFLKICAGVAMVVCSFAFLIQSSSPAQADAPTMTNSTGKYMMQMQCYEDSKDRFQYTVMVWNTETGESKFYAGSGDNGIGPALSKFQLPSSPL